MDDISLSCSIAYPDCLTDLARRRQSLMKKYNVNIEPEALTEFRKLLTGTMKHRQDLAKGFRKQLLNILTP